MFETSQVEAHLAAIKRSQVRIRSASAIARMYVRSESPGAGAQYTRASPHGVVAVLTALEVSQPVRVIWRRPAASSEATANAASRRRHEREAWPRVTRKTKVSILPPCTCVVPNASKLPIATARAAPECSVAGWCACSCLQRDGIRDLALWGEESRGAHALQSRVGTGDSRRAAELVQQI